MLYVTDFGWATNDESFEYLKALIYESDYISIYKDYKLLFKYERNSCVSDWYNEYVISFCECMALTGNIYTADQLADHLMKKFNDDVYQYFRVEAYKKKKPITTIDSNTLS